MVSQCDSLLSDTRACPAPLGASDSDAAGGMTKESHLERLKRIGSNPWGLHGDIVCGSGRLSEMKINSDKVDPDLMDGDKRYPTWHLSSIKTSSSWLYHTGSVMLHYCDW